MQIKIIVLARRVGLNKENASADANEEKWSRLIMKHLHICRIWKDEYNSAPTPLSFNSICWKGIYAKQNASVGEMGWFENTTKWKHLITEIYFDGRLITSMIDRNKF